MERPVLVDPYAAQAATGIKPGTIRVWLHRGKLTHHGHDHAGRGEGGWQCRKKGEGATSPQLRRTWVQVAGDLPR